MLAVPAQGSVHRGACAKAGVVPQPAVGREARAGVANDELVCLYAVEGTVAGVADSPDAVHGRYDPPGLLSCPRGVCAVPSPGCVAVGQCAAEGCAS